MAVQVVTQLVVVPATTTLRVLLLIAHCEIYRGSSKWHHCASLYPQRRLVSAT